jgi:hypothetical protein
MLRACGEHVATNIQTSCCEHFFSCSEELFPCCEHFFHVAPPPSSPDIVYMFQAMLRARGEHVASSWRVCCDRHPNIRCKFVGGWEGVRFFPRRTSDEEHYHRLNIPSNSKGPTWQSRIPSPCLDPISRHKDAAACGCPHPPSSTPATPALDARLQARLALSPPPLPLHLALSFFVRVHMAVASWEIHFIYFAFQGAEGCERRQMSARVPWGRGGCWLQGETTTGVSAGGAYVTSYTEPKY